MQSQTFEGHCICVCVFYQAMAGDSSGTRTRRLQATRSLSVAISLRGALLCIWRTPSICPLRLRPTLGGEETSVGELTDPTHTNQTCNQHQHYCKQYHPPPVYKDHLMTFLYFTEAITLTCSLWGVVRHYSS